MRVSLDATKACVQVDKNSDSDRRSVSFYSILGRIINPCYDPISWITDTAIETRGLASSAGAFSNRRSSRYETDRSQLSCS